MPNPDISAPPAPPADALTPGWQTLAGGIIRTGLGVLAGYLVRSGIVDAGQTGAIVDVGSGVVLGALVLGWSMLEKWLAQRKFATALSLPAGATAADVKQALKPCP